MSYLEPILQDDRKTASVALDFQKLTLGSGSSIDAANIDSKDGELKEISKRIFRISKTPPGNHSVEAYREEVSRIAREFWLGGARGHAAALGKLKVLDPNTRFTPLHNAVKRTNRALVKVFIELTETERYEFFGTVKDKTRMGSTPLHLAAASNVHNVDLIQTLLDAGSSLEAKNENGETPLAVAKKKNRPGEILRLLGDGDADLEDVEVTGQITPEEAERQRLARAKAEGDFFDLTKDKV